MPEQRKLNTRKQPHGTEMVRPRMQSGSAVVAIPQDYFTITNLSPDAIETDWYLAENGRDIVIAVHDREG